jgi:hypothetical protein
MTRDTLIYGDKCNRILLKQKSQTIEKLKDGKKSASKNTVANKGSAKKKVIILL